MWESQKILLEDWNGTSWGVCEDQEAEPIDFAGPVTGLPELPITDSASEFYAEVGGHPLYFMPHARWRPLEGSPGFLDDDIGEPFEGGEWIRASSATLELRGKNHGDGSDTHFVPEGGWVFFDAVIPDDGRDPEFENFVYGDGPNEGATLEVSISGITATNDQVTPNVVYKGIAGAIEHGFFHAAGPRQVGTLWILLVRADDPEYFP